MDVIGIPVSILRSGDRSVRGPTQRPTDQRNPRPARGARDRRSRGSL